MVDMFSRILVFDPSIATKNIGDRIIAESVYGQLKDIFPCSHIFNLPTKLPLSRGGVRLARETDIAFMGGTNLLSSKIIKRKKWRIKRSQQWQIRFREALQLRDSDVVTFGVGWHSYQGQPNLPTRLMLDMLLSRKYLHSVRDSFTENQLRAIGYKNVINTACPTMWLLDEEHCKNIPKERGSSAIITFTDYRPDIERDRQIFQIVERNYEKVYIWIQGSEDFSYFKKITQDNLSRAEIVPPDLGAYDSILSKEESLDYIGTRLHAGIRALQKRKRSIIISVDNRATEKSKDFRLVVIERDRADLELNKKINSDFSTEIILPKREIELWKNQFLKKGLPC
jgi:polysaccharide pyruvyl transferase WcaK-like protein